MRVLWLCNIMLPMIAEQLHMEASNKEGWLSGLANVVLDRRGENGIELAVVFPAAPGLAQTGAECHVYNGIPVYKGIARTPMGELLWYAFGEDVVNPHIYDEHLEQGLYEITQDFKPDVVHCFGTEYPHTLAMCRVFPHKQRILVGIQGLCRVYAENYFASLPEKVICSRTLRDVLKKDSIRQQQRKFALRGEMEYEAVRLAGNVTGRTAWDRYYTSIWNPEARYFEMNETLRPDFYTQKWRWENCEKNSIFLSQGDYPIKGLHYMLQALPAIRAQIPDVKVYVAGNSIIGDLGPAKRLKISAYGRYLRSLIRRYRLQGQVCFLGRLNAREMKERYLKSNLFVCCSSIENSPNSLGEAMLLGVPCVSADVGGISSIFTDNKDGILYKVHKLSENKFNNTCDEKYNGLSLDEISKNLADSVINILLNKDLINRYSDNARNHAKITHDSEKNYQKMMEIYTEIAGTELSSEKKKESCGAPVSFVFVSNYINHHQIPFCNAMYERLKGSFVFVQTEPMEEERIRMGWQKQDQLPYVKYFYQERELCRKLIAESDVVLFGGTDEESYITERLKAQKPVIRYSERLYKEGQWKAVSPRGLIKKYRDHTRYRKKPVYLLCAGAYVPSDFHIVRAYSGKMFKWGYFPATRHYDVDRLMEQKEPGSILWAARFLDWKHPEAALACAAYLRAAGYSFHMRIAGDGQMRPLVDRLLEEYDLKDHVTLLGYRSPDEVRSLMEKSRIYLATSDRREGWGAVLNEAMNSGCAVVASHMMGAAPYLIRQGENGVIYQNGDQGNLNGIVEALLQDEILCEGMGRTAIGTIECEWNAETAADRLLGFCRGKGFLDGTLREDSRDVSAGEINLRQNIPLAGPCSEAEVIGERKMLWKIRRKAL